jgi:prepilin-type processing-associated H-X9-DG protein
MNLAQVGKALYYYRQANNEYYPFAWQRTDAPPPSGDGSVNAALAMTSIGSLYPQYLGTAKSFRCPGTEDVPSFVRNGVGPEKGEPYSAQAGRENWTLQQSSYGYDCRISPKAVAGHPVLADMPGPRKSKEKKVRHQGRAGMNVLYVDSHVRWKQDNFCSNDPNDNIFTEDPWNADTDSYLLRMDTGLGKSFKDYPSLHYR